eukprot:g61.t1
MRHMFLHECSYIERARLRLVYMSKKAMAKFQANNVIGGISNDSKGTVDAPQSLKNAVKSMQNRSQALLKRGSNLFTASEYYATPDDIGHNDMQKAKASVNRYKSMREKNRKALVTDLLQLSKKNQIATEITKLKQVVKKIEESLRTRFPLCPGGQGSASTEELVFQSGYVPLHEMKNREKYINKLKSIRFNLKSNVELFKSVYSGDVTPEQLVKMDAKDMASRKRQLERESFEKERQKDSTLEESVVVSAKRRKKQLRGT